MDREQAKRKAKELRVAGASYSQISAALAKEGYKARTGKPLGVNTVGTLLGYKSPAQRAAKAAKRAAKRKPTTTAKRPRAAPTVPRHTGLRKLVATLLEAPMNDEVLRETLHAVTQPTRSQTWIKSS